MRFPFEMICQNPLEKEDRDKINNLEENKAYELYIIQINKESVEKAFLGIEKKDIKKTILENTSNGINHLNLKAKIYQKN